jgi:hypothetical protein
MHAHEEAAGEGITVLVGIDDIAAVLEQQAGNGVHDARLVRAGKVRINPVVLIFGESGN